MKKITFFGLLFLFSILTYSQGTDCTDPIIISSLPYNTTDDTSNYGDNYSSADRPALGGEQYVDGTGTGSYLDGDDAVYAFTPAANGVFSFNLTNPSDWVSLWLFEGCPFTSIVARHTNTSGATRSLPNLNLVGGTTYYIVISSWPAPQSIAYTLNVTEITCPEPTNLVTTNITVDSVNITWDAGGSETEWEYALLLTSDPAPTSGTVIASTAFSPSGLTNNTDYTFYVRANCGVGDESTFVSIDFSTLALPPSNDDCGTAEVVTLGAPGLCGPDVTGNNTGATDSGVAQASCTTSTYSGGDLWYQFTTGATQTQVTYNRSASAFSTTVVEFYSGTCGALVEESCTNAVSTDFTGLAPSTTYYLRIYDWGNDNFGDVVFCLESPPTCPEPINLLPTPISTTETDITWDAGGVETMWNYEYGTTGFTQGGAGSIGSGTVMSAPGTVALSNLTAGTEYDIYVQADCGGGDTSTFALLAFTQPNTGGACAVAIPAAVETDCAAGTPFSLQYGTNSSDLGGVFSCDTTTGNNGVWLEFTAPATGGVTANLVGSTAEIAIFDACGGTELVCLGTSNSRDIAELIPGNTYYLAVWKDGATSGTTDICLEEYTPPANNACENATPITVSTDFNCDNSISGSTQGGTTNSANGCSIVGRDVWYVFTAPADGDYIINETETFDSGTTSTYVAAFEGICGALTQIGSSTSCSNSNALTITAVSGTSYYISIRSSSATTYTEFDLCIYQPTQPINDACADAIAINDGDSLMEDTTLATNVETLPKCEGGTVGTTCDPAGDSTPNAGTLVFGNGVWYVYSSLGNESISIEASGFDTELQVFSGVCGSLTCVAGDDDSSNNGSGSFVCFDATTATDYYIYVDGNTATTTGVFTLNLNTTPLPPTNDECTDAEALTLGTMVSGDTSSATDSGIAAGSCGATGGDQDIWYSFAATATGQVDIDTTADTVVVYDACGGTEVACVGEGTTNVMGLVDGTTYYARVYNTGIAKVAGPIELTISEATLSTTDFDNGSIFSYYPNPVNNTLTLNARNEISNVAVFNMLGQEVIRTAPNTVSNEVDMSNLQSGAYFVQVTVGQATQTVRIIKN